MKRLPLNADDATILAAVRDWIALLVDGRYQDAYDYLAHAEGEDWTPQLIETVIRNYGSVEPLGDGETYRVTPPETATGGPAPRHEATRFDGVRGYVWFDLALNGKWSDLTATLSFDRDSDTLVLTLDNIHVM